MTNGNQDENGYAVTLRLPTGVMIASKRPCFCRYFKQCRRVKHEIVLQRVSCVRTYIAGTENDYGLTYMHNDVLACLRTEWKYLKIAPM